MTNKIKPSELLSKRGAWTQQSLARDSDGLSCMPEEEDAVCFCAIGAIEKCAWTNSERRGMVAKLIQANPEIRPIKGRPFSKAFEREDAIERWNDNKKTKKGDVIAAFVAAGL